MARDTYIIETNEGDADWKKHDAEIHRHEKRGGSSGYWILRNNGWSEKDIVKNFGDDE